MHSVVMILLKSLQSVTTPNCPMHFHTSTSISSLPPALPHFIPLSALSVSASLTGLVMPWLDALSSVSTRGFSSFMSQLKYWPHRSLMYSSFISTSSVALLMVPICPMSFLLCPKPLRFCRPLSALHAFPCYHTVQLLFPLSLSQSLSLLLLSLVCTL